MSRTVHIPVAPGVDKYGMPNPTDFTTHIEVDEAAAGHWAEARWHTAPPGFR